MNKTGIMRQGDVILIPCSDKEVTSNHRAVPNKNGRIVLAEGEVTGHFHAIHRFGPATTLLRAEGISDRVLTVDVDAMLDHDEHGSIALGPGNYIVRIQREWSGEDERQVQD